MKDEIYQSFNSDRYCRLISIRRKLSKTYFHLQFPRKINEQKALFMKTVIFGNPLLYIIKNKSNTIYL